MPDYDVVVVGAGPSGAAAAIRCAKFGFKTLVIEKRSPGRHKPCGGVLPIVSNDIINYLGLNIPEIAMSSPPSLGLFYVPPSGRRNGGRVKGYSLLNVNRDRFDQWLCENAKAVGVEVSYETELVEFHSGTSITLKAVRKGIAHESTTHYMIGADGACSEIRKSLYPDLKMKLIYVLQEYWEAGGELEECFYVFFRERITPIYAYLVPKDDIFLLGTALHVPRIENNNAMFQFKRWLEDEFSFHFAQLQGREAGVIPYDMPVTGTGNTILVGDAAGFCNPMSGEGIRLAIESGISAAEAVQEAESNKKPLASCYSTIVEGLKTFVTDVHEFAASLTDKDREKFVQSELARAGLAL